MNAQVSRSQSKFILGLRLYRCYPFFDVTSPWAAKISAPDDLLTSPAHPEPDNWPFELNINFNIFTRVIFQIELELAV
ncbi:MAG: hypothetical protein WBO47_05465 [Gammaproteobacteria bacterium]